MATEEQKASTYTESHKKYYERYKALINARRRDYNKQYKKMWYKKNRERILLERALKRLENKNLSESVK